MAIDKNESTISAPIITPSSYKALLESYGIKDRREPEFFNKFARIGIIDPYTAITSAKEYLFFTKPDLNILSNKDQERVAVTNSGTTQNEGDGVSEADVYWAPGTPDFSVSTDRDLNPELANYSFFDEMKNRYSQVLDQLQLSRNPSQPFMCMLSNSVKDSLDLPDINTREVDTPQTVYGTSITYEADDFSTDENHSFSLEFQDTKYLEIYMLFKCWHEYLRRKTFGEVSPRNFNYITDKILHDQIAIYKFIVGEDGETLVYWAKLYGCRPQQVPRATFSELNPSSNGIGYSISWKAAFVEDMDPMILADFNDLTGASGASLTTFDPKVSGMPGTWAGSAYISVQRNDYQNNPRSLTYKLKWTE